MKNIKIQLLVAGLLLGAAGFMPVCAQEKNKDEKKLETSAVTLDKDAAKPEGEKVVADKLKTEFKVDDARVQALRDQKLGYGEISIVLALSEKMPGGINDANVQKIMGMRQGPPVMGWGNIAKSLDLKLGQVVSKVHKTQTEAHKRIKNEKMKTEKGEKGEKGEKMEKHERAEKMERPDKGGRPEGAGKH